MKRFYLLHLFLSLVLLHLLSDKIEHFFGTVGLLTVIISLCLGFGGVDWTNKAYKKNCGLPASFLIGILIWISVSIIIFIFFAGMRMAESDISLLIISTVSFLGVFFSFGCWAIAILIMDLESGNRLDNE